MYSVMWSEHCSYKSTKVHLKQFGEIPQETPVGKMLAGIGENAGVLDIGQGYAVTFKVESHNHPSFVEPYQGAATGVGGIVRDILAMGARPVAVMDPLRFGPLDAPDTARVLPGIVAGVGGYGNCLGLPNIGGEAVFDETYSGNPLVNALCVGVLRHEDLHLANASGTGNQVVLYGARTGGDGIGGVSVLASRDLRRGRPGQAPERPGRRPVHGEAAHRVHPRALRRRRDRRHPGPRRRRALLRDLRARLGRRRRHARRARPRPAARLHARSRGDPHERVAGADDGGRRARRRRGLHGDLREVGRRGRRRRRGHRHRPPAHRLARRARRRRTPAVGGARRPDLPAPLRPPRLAGRAAGRRRRDALRPPVDRRRAARHAAAPGRLAQPLRQVVDHRPVRPLRPGQHRPRAAGRLGHGARRRRDQPRRLGLHRLQRPLRQARPLHRRPARAGRVLPQRRHRRRAAARGLRLPQLRLARGPGGDVAVRRGLPRPQGRLPRARHPGHRRQRQPLQPDRRDRDPADPGGRRARRHRGRHPSYADRLRAPRASRCSCSARPARSSPGSEWAHVVHGHLGGLPPRLDLAAEQALAALLQDASRDGVVTSAHDLSDGGLAQALAESTFARDIGVTVSLGRRRRRRPLRRALLRVRRPRRW